MCSDIWRCRKWGAVDPGQEGYLHGDKLDVYGQPPELRPRKWCGHQARLQFIQGRTLYLLASHLCLSCRDLCAEWSKLFVKLNTIKAQSSVNVIGALKKGEPTLLLCKICGKVEKYFGGLLKGEGHTRYRELLKFPEMLWGSIIKFQWNSAWIFSDI